MDRDVVLWLIAQGIAIGAAGLGTLMMVHRNLVSKIERGDGELHTRVNDVREKYVRRDDLDTHLSLLREQMNKMDAKLDRILERQTQAE